MLRGPLSSLLIQKTAIYISMGPSLRREENGHSNNVVCLSAAQLQSWARRSPGELNRNLKKGDSRPVHGAASAQPSRTKRKDRSTNSVSKTYLYRLYTCLLRVTPRILKQKRLC